MIENVRSSEVGVSCLVQVPGEVFHVWSNQGGFHPSRHLHSARGLSRIYRGLSSLWLLQPRICSFISLFQIQVDFQCLLYLWKILRGQ